MTFITLFHSFINEQFKQNAETVKAIDQFIKNVPKRIISMEFDETKSSKQGVKLEEEVYKLGLDLESGICFIEYLSRREQSEPTMAIYANRTKPSLHIQGSQSGKKFYLAFTVKDGRVVKSQKLV